MENSELLNNKREQLLEFFEVEDLLSETFDTALMGYVERAGGTRFVLYEEEKFFEWFETEPFPQKKFILFLTKQTGKSLMKHIWFLMVLMTLLLDMHKCMKVILL